MNYEDRALSEDLNERISNLAKDFMRVKVLSIAVTVLLNRMNNGETTQLNHDQYKILKVEPEETLLQMLGGDRDGQIISVNTYDLGINKGYIQ